MSAGIIFRLYPSETTRSLYVRVRVWRTQRAMFRRLKRGRGYQAICIANLPRDRRCRDPREVAEIHVTRRLFRADVMAHELLHAAFVWGERVGVRLPAARGGFLRSERVDDEERICYALQELLAQCRDRAIKLGLGETW